MENLLRIKTDKDKYIFIKEHNICTAEKHGKHAILLRMANGEEIVCVDTPYEMWENESLVR